MPFIQFYNLVILQFSNFPILQFGNFTIPAICWLLLLVTFIQILYYLFVFRRLARYKNLPQNPLDKPLPVSVIICAKNEANNLKQYLPTVLKQDYPNFEVVVVNDCSTDETATILSYFCQHYNHLSLVTVLQKDKIGQGKKYALIQGIKAARHDYLLLTDADCMPASPHWISLMMRHFKPNIGIVLGYAPFFTQKGFLNRICRHENVFTAAQYLGFALAGMPYMGVGRNLAYRKSLFDPQILAQKKQVASGDDDLFVNAVATAQNTAIELDVRSFCYSATPTSWKNWFRQKQRHLSTGKYYQFYHQMLLGGLSLSHFAFYGMLIAGLLYGCHFFVILLFALRLVIQNWIFYPILKQLKQADLMVSFTGADALYILYYLIFTPSLFLTKNATWKQQPL